MEDSDEVPIGLGGVDSGGEQGLVVLYPGVGDDGQARQKKEHHEQQNNGGGYVIFALGQTNILHFASWEFKLANGRDGAGASPALRRPR
jgi:hypothetical protein